MVDLLADLVVFVMAASTASCLVDYWESWRDIAKAERLAAKMDDKTVAQWDENAAASKVVWTGI